MKAGFYRDEEDMVDVDTETVSDAAQVWADEHHQIDEASDMEFNVYVLDNDGKLHLVKMYTEFDPRYEIKSSEIQNN